ncbi:MAG: hypothetical protein HYR91_12655 [Flavobacteriia bacterium]|nr:hypothetical protein [Flavobacteriia bacterium]
MTKNFFHETDDNNQYSWFLALYIFTVILNYFTPDIIRFSYYIVLLIVFFRSRNNGFWIAFFWCLIYAPAYLFNVADQNFSLPYFGLPGLGRDIAYTEILIIIIFIKSVVVKNTTTIKVNPIFWLLVVFSLFLFYVGMVWGFTTNKAFRTIRFLIPYTLIWSIPKLIPTTHQMRTIFNYFLIFTIPVVLCQIYVIFSGQHLMFLLGGSFSGKKENLNDIQFDSIAELIRPLYSTHILLLNVFYCLYLLLAKKIGSFTNQLKFIPFYLILSFLSFLITGTRGYVLACVLMFILYFFFNVKKIFININYTFIGIALFFLLTITPKIGEQFSFSLERIFTIQSIINGDQTANGTLRRLTDRQPIVMANVAKSPIIGFGFSNFYFEHADGHVANPTMLLNSGIIGLCIFIYFNLYIFFEAYRLYIRTKRLEILAIIIGILGFLLVHSTSYMVFSFAIGQGNVFAFILLLTFSNVIIEEYKKKYQNEYNKFGLL